MEVRELGNKSFDDELASDSKFISSDTLFYPQIFNHGNCFFLFIYRNWNQIIEIKLKNIHFQNIWQSIFIHSFIHSWCIDHRKSPCPCKFRPAWIMKVCILEWALWNRNSFEFKLDDTRISSYYKNKIGPIRIFFDAFWLCKLSALLAVSVCSVWQVRFCEDSWRRLL